jgi:hypothetical protein
MTKITPTMTHHLVALSGGPRPAYPGLSLRTLDALYMRGLIKRDYRVGNMAFPHTSIFWSLTDAGHEALTAAEAS